jgi:hypothetical protein
MSGGLIVGRVGIDEVVSRALAKRLPPHRALNLIGARRVVLSPGSPDDLAGR